VESLIINADSSKGRNPWHLAASTVNENVIKEVNLQAMKWTLYLFLFFFFFLPSAPLHLRVHFPQGNLFWHQVTALPGAGHQFLANWSYLRGRAI